MVSRLLRFAPPHLNHRGSHLNHRAVALIISLLAPLAWLVLGSGPANAATPSADAEGCIQSSHGVHVHFVLDFSRPKATVSGLALSGFDKSSCDGQPVKIILSGNEAGNPAADPTETLSTLDSTVDACNGTAVPDNKQALIENGSITLRGCATTDDSSLGAYADVLPLTRLTVYVAGQEVTPEVLGTEAFANGVGGSANAGTSLSGTDVSGASVLGLPLTGGPHSWLFWLGLLLFVLGLASLVFDRLRDSHAIALARVRRPEPPTDR
ncbi:MAG TPA: hypothetical protein VFJ19_09760 [Nocardioidaceae bacterium]|nr:hypothetical protein [Nocardioidaceae bacterium]